METSESFSNDKTEYSGQEELLKLGIRVEVSAEENEDAVFIIFHRTRQQDGIFTVYVMDASGSQRFPHTFSISSDMPLDTYREKYISRERLISDPDDFLPNGTLTLMIEARLMLRTLETFPLLKTSKEILLNFDLHKESLGLLLDSPLAKRLAEESDVFRAIIQRMMNEETTNIIPIRGNEVDALFLIARLLLMPGSPITLPSIKKVFDMYIFADMYNIPLVRETCKCFLKLYASVHTVDRLLEYVEPYEHIHLRDLLVNLINLIRQTNFAEEIDQTHSDFVCLKQPIHECLWVYVNPGDSNQIIFFREDRSKKTQLIK